jgi:hypothetical protein
MAFFDAQNPDFEASVRRSFERLTLMRTLGARLLVFSTLLPVK